MLPGLTGHTDRSTRTTLIRFFSRSAVLYRSALFRLADTETIPLRPSPRPRVPVGILAVFRCVPSRSFSLLCGFIPQRPRWARSNFPRALGIGLILDARLLPDGSLLNDRVEGFLFSAADGIRPGRSGTPWTTGSYRTLSLPASFDAYA
jgi:hypothetical protein